MKPDQIIGQQPPQCRKVAVQHRVVACGLELLKQLLYRPSWLFIWCHYRIEEVAGAVKDDLGWGQGEE